MALPVSTAWKARFMLIDRAGGASLPSLHDLDTWQQRMVRWNGWALVFWPGYYLYLKMVQKGALMVGLSLLLMLIAAVLLKGFGLGILSNALYIVPGIYFARQANTDYYRKMVLREPDGDWLRELLK
ncbi:DUF2628 domain-containing protein [Massilia sp. CF038]|uniref:DUF2628 domain-containing protein n=1 Tax=Massilia sp. CF038 TaxID=1881045 RepID=UPI0015B3B6C1|nr:DUF2628 domain-containing protein [Massilia sp. CF038]